MNDGLTRRVADEPRAAAADAASRAEFARRTLIAVTVVGLAVAVGAAFARASDVFFLFYAAVLLAILLRTAGDWVAGKLGVGPGWGLGLVVLVLAALVAGGLFAVGSMAASQVNQLADDLPKSVDQARTYVARYPWGQELLDRLPSAQNLAAGGGAGGAAARLASFLSTTLGVLGNLVVLTFLTLR